MDPAVRSSLLWGVVGALAFLVLVQAYHIAADGFVDPAVVGGVTVAVALASTGLAHRLRPLLHRLLRDNSIE